MTAGNSTCNLSAAVQSSTFHLQPPNHSFLEKNENEKRTPVHRPLLSFLEKN